MELKFKMKSLPAAIIFIVLGAFSAIRVFSWIRWMPGYGLVTLILDLAYIGLGVLLIRKMHDKFLMIPFAVIALINLILTGGIYSVLNLLWAVAVVAVMVVNFLPKFDEYKEMVNKFWFVPAILRLIPTLISIFSHFRFLTLLLGIVEAAGILLLCVWVINPDFSETSKVAAAPVTDENGTPVAPVVTDTAKNYVSMVTHILLLLFTCGVWLYIWIYRTTEFLNCTPGSEYRNPTTKLLLCMFVPFYSIYWMYKSAQQIDTLAQSKNLHSDLALPCLLLAIFVPIIAPILMQDKINQIVTTN